MYRLSIIAIVLTALIIGCTKSNSISAEDFQMAIGSNSEAVVIDVRSPEEFVMGHIEGAQNVSIHSREFDEKAVELAENGEVYVYCKSGSRSSDAVKRLAKLGVKTTELNGGLRAWEQAGFGIESTIEKVKTKYSLQEYNDFIANHELILVDFYADWCGPCKAMAPHIAAVKDEHPEKLTILKVNTDHSQAISRHFNIMGIPLVKVYHQGKEVYDKTGYHSKEELEAVLQSYL